MASIGYDFIMDPYELDADPAGRPTSRDLLMAIPPTPAAAATMGRIVDAIVAAVGPERTVWGAKWTGDGPILWEFYGYATRRPRDWSTSEFIDRFREAFASVGGWNAPTSIPANTNLASFEFHIGDDGTVDPPEAVDVYHGVSGADMIVNYEHTHEHLRLKNTYELFYGVDDIDRIAVRLAENRFADPEVTESLVAHWSDRIRAARRCTRVWCSYKPHYDGIYLGQVHVEDLAGFLDDFAYPDPVRCWVRGHLDELDHLRHDLGMDYVVENGRVRVDKTGFYGYF